MRRTIGVLTAALLVTAGTAWMVQREPVWRVPLPPPGQAVPAFLGDGLPVFVVHDPTGAVHVLDARNPHRNAPWWKLVGWCPSSQVFEDPWHGSRFGPDGGWFGGPSPRGLAAFAATVRGGVVEVGSRGDEPPRTPDPHDVYEPQGPSCMGVSGHDAVRAGLVAHDALLPGRLPWLPDAVRAGRGRWLPARGAVVQRAGSVVMCSASSAEPPRCEDEIAWPHGAGFSADGVAWHGARGRFLVLAEGGRVRDLAVLAVTRVDVRMAAE